MNALKTINEGLSSSANCLFQAVEGNYHGLKALKLTHASYNPSSGFPRRLTNSLSSIFEKAGFKVKAAEGQPCMHVEHVRGNQWSFYLTSYDGWSAQKDLIKAVQKQFPPRAPAVRKARVT